MAKVYYSSLAARDLCDNAEYIARDKPDAAYHWVVAIKETCERLALNPEMGERRSIRNLGHCRSFTYGKYVIFFRGAADSVEIIRVVRGDRDVEQLRAF
ncbi:MAG: type II toxin-antitoxin system RelE/ParE family toxin [Planctomycetota bacterium]